MSTTATIPALEKSIVIDAPPARVWKALTDPAEIKVYLFGTNTISDWKKGSALRFVGEWEGKSYEDKGTILQLDVDRCFQYSYWSAFSGLPDVPENYMVVTNTLEPQGTGTLLKVRQDAFANPTQREQSDHNWDGVLKAIKKLVEG
ncbi:MAG: SRPBCC domain-containing protein [Flavobacteriales bacterium]